MRKWFYTRLAFSNMLKNRRTYVPYLITSTFTVAMFFMMAALAFEQGLDALPAGVSFVRSILSLGVIVVALFAAIFLFYTHSFLIKRRKKEIGLFNILGMEKKHLAKLMLIETAFTALISIGLGIALGMLLSRLMALLLCRILGVALAFSVSFSLLSILPTIALFFCIFLLTFLHAVWQVHLTAPIDLLKGSNVGEKEPKNKWLLTLIGLIALGGGYYLALSITNPVFALTVFFLAVILVIIGTYLLFTCGSITFIKALKRNKRFYYQTNHFISVSGMLYRMKQNAVGLANICILSTMVLVMLSTTTALIAGLNEAIKNRYPSEFSVQIPYESEEAITKINNLVETAVEARGGRVETQWQLSYIDCLVTHDAPDHLSTEQLEQGDDYYLHILAQQDFTALTGLGAPLNNDEAMVFSETLHYTEPFIKIDDISLRVALSGQTDALSDKFESFVTIFPDLYVVVKDVPTFLTLFQTADVSTRFRLHFDTGLSEDTQLLLKEDLLSTLPFSSGGFLECRASGGQETQAMYAGFFFLGLFLGLLFLMATVLILYYKQLSEGTDDKQRFTIMQNVGLSHREVQRAIHSQTLTLFFLPLFAAFTHLLFAYPMIKRIMLLMNLPDSAPFTLFTIITCALFALFYLITYLLTARTYAKIVTEQ